MNNEWLNSLRSRMEDHEEDIPDGLWDDIRDELFSEEDKNATITGLFSENQHDTEVESKLANIGSRKKPWVYRVGGIAAAVALLFLIIKMLPVNSSQKTLSQKSANSRKEEEKIAAPGKSENQNNSNREEAIPLSSDFPLVQNSFNIEGRENSLKALNFKKQGQDKVNNNELLRKLEKNPETIAMLSYEYPESQKIASANENISDSLKEKTKDEVLFKELPKEVYAENLKNKAEKSQEKKSWMLSMLTGNVSSNSAVQQFPGYASMDGKPMNTEQVWSASEYTDDPLTAIFLANQSQPVEARIRHKIPVTFGLSLYYNLGKNWGIGTGLNYTKLASELHSGTEANYIKGDQIVHYIGIPVQVNYNVVQKGRFTGYVTGGALLEMPVSGSITTNYIVNDEIKETSKERLEHKPLQFSVNTAIGFQLKVIDKFGIYAEPGIGYHFKGDNAPNTIYKEKPLHFNIKFGVRLLLD